MKGKFIFILTALLLASCGKEKTSASTETVNTESTISDPVAEGKKLFEGAGNCFACHLPDQKVIGPSIVEIADIYKKEKASIVDFLKEDAPPIVDPSQYEAMKTNFVITKQMSDSQLKALEAYILSHAK